MATKTDSEIEQAVLRELSLNRNIHSREVCVFASQGVVRIKGSARSRADQLAVEESVKRVTDIAGVVNEMIVKPAPAPVRYSSASAKAADALRDQISYLIIKQLNTRLKRQRVDKRHR
jgi:osmotically-inducible protein OsmY